MKLTNNQSIPLPIDIVWQGLNDPQVLQQCIPGCDEVVQVDNAHYTLKMVATVGPVRVRFVGALETRDVLPPHSYSLLFDGKGGAAGFASGKANVKLIRRAPALTDLHYEVEAQIGGKLAQIGARLVDSVAAKTAEAFFATFTTTMSSRLESPSEHAVTVESPAKPPGAPPNKRRGWSLLAAGLVVALAALYLFLR